MTLRSLFSSDKAVLSMLKQIDFRPDLIHCHDWDRSDPGISEKMNFRQTLLLGDEINHYHT